MNVHDQVRRYKEAEFIPLPLAQLSKCPPKGSTLSTIEIDQPYEEDSNIGLFVGSPNGLVVIDCDDDVSKECVEDKLESMGLLEQTTTVLSPKRAGLHFWLRIIDVPEGAKAFYNLADDIGCGEFRLHRNAYVVAPDSVLHSGKYRFIRGGPEKFLSQPVVKWKDFEWLLPPNVTYYEVPNTKPLTLPIRLIFRPSPKITYYFKRLKYAEKGDPINKIDFTTGEFLEEQYKSRSEVEAAIVMCLILAGWSFDEIFQIFEAEEPRNYAEEKSKTQYLLRTYNSALSCLMMSKKRKIIADVYDYACLKPWSGRNGSYDQKVILALLSKAWQLNTYQPSISLREISEHSAINRINTISDVLKRLNKRDYIETIPTKQYETKQYDLKPFIFQANNRYINSQEGSMFNVSVIDTSIWSCAELWRRDMLGGSARLVFTHLSEQQKTIADLVELTGKTWNTVKSALDKLEQVGLAASVGKGWIRGERCLADVCIEYETKQLALKRQQRHEKERRAFEDYKRAKQIR